MNVSTAEVQAAFKRSVEIARAVAEAIRETGEIPSGTLYALLMSHLSLAEYEQVIDTLVAAELITNNGHLLRWVGETA